VLGSFAGNESYEKNCGYLLQRQQAANEGQEPDKLYSIETSEVYGR